MPKETHKKLITYISLCSVVILLILLVFTFTGCTNNNPTLVYNGNITNIYKTNYNFPCNVTIVTPDDNYIYYCKESLRIMDYKGVQTFPEWEYIDQSWYINRPFVGDYWVYKVGNQYLIVSFILIANWNN